MKVRQNYRDTHKKSKNVFSINEYANKPNAKNDATKY